MRLREITTLSMAAVLALTSLAGCIESATQRCSWGRVCPSGTRCSDDHLRCVSPGQVEACREQPDGQECLYPGVQPGSVYCMSGLCILAECGDGVAGGPEACDDGNTESGDGCSADCRSDETCGNEHVDPINGEGCDDGNAVNHDGCTSACAQEVATWSEVWGTIPGLFGMGVASDTDLGRVIVFGGVHSEGSFLDAAWSFDGSSWERIEFPVQPPARMDTAMTYDASRQRVVLHGGWSGIESLGDTWELQGETWELVPTANAPVPRSGAPLVHDAARQVLVLYGGELADRTALDTTWEYDGVDWQQVSVATPPPARRYHSLAYDPLRGRVVLFGGSYGATEWTYFGDTWEYDGASATWTEIPTPAGATPSPRDGHALVWDPSRQRLVLFGGVGPAGQYSDTWEYDPGGPAWIPVNTSGPMGTPSSRSQFAFALDPTAPRLLLLGGTTGAYQAWDDMWELRGKQWSPVTSRLPGPRLAAAMVYDDARGRLVLYGGVTSAPVGDMIDETWEHDGHTWQRRRPVSSPGARAGHAFAHDSQRQRTVLFGGMRSMSLGDCADDTWEYDGFEWMPLALPPGERPPARGVASMAYDPARQRVVLFGGTCHELTMADTWVFDGAGWQELTPADPSAPWPPGRAGAAMAWDEARQSVILFGGQTEEGTDLGDTWELDGDGWHPIATLADPAPRAGHSLVYNAARGFITLFGGVGTGSTADTWELQGAIWVPANVTHPPSGRYSVAAAYFPPRAGIFAHGGYTWSGVVLDDWLQFRYEGAFPDEVCFGGLDEDGDSLLDCEDPDCEGRPCGFMQFCVFGQCY